MVRLFASLLATSLLLGSLANPLKRNVTTIKNDLTSVKLQVTFIDNAITAFPANGGSLLDALEYVPLLLLASPHPYYLRSVHSEVGILNTAVISAAADVEANGHINEADGQAIVAQFKEIQPAIIDALKESVDKKSAVEALPLNGAIMLVRSDLTTLNASMSALGSALIGAAPVSVDFISQSEA
jgi:hypothetical protein